VESAERNARIAELLGGGAVRIFEIGTVFTKDGEEIRLGLAAADDSKKRAASKEALREAAAMLAETFGAQTSLADQPFEISLASLSNGSGEYRYGGDGGVRYERFSPYPFIIRDIAVFIPAGGDHEEIPRIVAHAAGPLLARHRLFDTFSKEIDGSLMTSYAYRFVFQSSEKTLTDEEVNTIMEAASQDIARKGWIIR
jgi:phenylalanyl-tRNA synthetase beta subunit